MFLKFAVLMTAALPLAFAADVRIVEEIAAKVNGDIITRGELEQQRRDFERGARGEGLSGAKLQESLKEFTSSALMQQIDQLLLVQKAKDLNISVDSEVTREMADLQVRAKISDPDKFRVYIQEQTGLSAEEYKDRLKRSMLAQRVIGQEVGYRMNVPEADLRKYYEEHKDAYVRKEQVFLSQILISTDGKTPEQVALAEQKAKDIMARANKGEKYSELVRVYSDDPETARSGGSLPPYERGIMPKNMEDVVFKEKKGTVVGPFKTTPGFVILRIDERFEAGQASFEEVKSQIQEEMTRPKMEPKIREFLTRLRTEAFLEIKDGYIDSGAAPGKDTRWHDVAQLKPQTTTKEEVAARVHRHKKFLFIPIPGTTRKPATKDVLPDAAPPAPKTTTEPAKTEPDKTEPGKAESPAKQ
jgi:peptidyl-prolyl cis-trans isomerase SurA